MKLQVRLLSVAAVAGFSTCVSAQIVAPTVSSWRFNLEGTTGTSTDAAIDAVVSGILADVQRVRHNAADAYINATGIPSYSIGPWSDGNPAVATNRNWLFRISKSPSEQTGTKPGTPLGPIGVFVNGVVMFNAKDAHSFNNAGVWNQNAVVVEADGFDSANGHPAPATGAPVGGFQPGIYHHHQQSPSLRDQLGDDGAGHSPILGFAFDGFSVYGPYGYANSDGSGGVARMRSSYRLRTGLRPPPPGAPGGPFDGFYVEDFEYVAGLGDLDQYNGRFTVTPEYPLGTYAYFATIDEAGESAYPYLIGPGYYGVVAAENLNQSVTVPGDALDFFGLNVPAMSTWGSVALTLLIVGAGCVVLRRTRGARGVLTDALP